MINDEGERLARVETKLDTLTELIKNYFESNAKADERLRQVELETIRIKSTHEEASKQQRMALYIASFLLATLEFILKWGIK